MENPDSDATRDAAPSIAQTAQPDVGDTFVDEPERYAVEGRIGAGGMGTVLAAKGSRLGRPVALKVVTADRDDLRRRFEREAQVTAKLQHPSIVPVYGSGRRDGQPFYAMKHVTGEPLDVVIAKATSLNERIALLPKVIAVTEAIAYAHSENVIHRDLKPANILVGAFGETVVIDWGLAKDLGAIDDEPSVSPYRGSGDETAHGKVMGTPAYMPLEQARGEPVDARADVYALGAILYHVLAGRAPYKRAGEDSVAWESMLARVIAGSPEPLGDDVPPDLRAIVTRAMARDAKDRYPSAGELAEDLRRFQTGQLVGAHRYSTWSLVKRWLRRNRTPVLVGLVAFVVLVCLGIVSVLRIVREQKRTEEQRIAAVTSRGQAEDLMGFMLVDLRDKLQPLGKLELLDAVAKKAIAYYADRDDADSPDEQAKRSQALSNIGDVLLARGDSKAALTQYRAALAIREVLAMREPDNASWRHDLAVSHRNVGEVLEAQGNGDAAIAEYRTAISLSDSLPHQPAWDNDLGLAHLQVGGILFSRADLPGALKEYELARARREQVLASEPGNPTWQRNLSVSQNSVGNVKFRQGDLEGALVEYRAALALRQHLVDSDPGNTLWQRDVALSYEKVGMALESKDVTGALAAYRAGNKVRELLAAKDPSNMVWQNDLAISYSHVGDALRDHGEVAEALEAQRAALRVQEMLVGKDAANAVWQRQLSVAHTKVGDAMHILGDANGVVAEYEAALAITVRLAELDPTNKATLRDLSIDHGRLGELHLEHKDLAKALAEFQASLELQEKISKLDPSDVEWRSDIAISHEWIGDVRVEQHDLTDAATQYGEGLAIIEALLEKQPDNLHWRRIAHVFHNKLGSVHLARAAPDAAIAEFAKGLAIAEALVAADPTNNDRLDDLAASHSFLGDAQTAANDRRRARESYQASARIVEAILASSPKYAPAVARQAALRVKLEACCGR